jgi:hypothetical protein
VSGGKVLITSLVGEVTTVIQTQADATKLTFDPRPGATQDLCATTDITADAVGTIYSITGTPATALQDALNFLPSNKGPAQPIVLKPGAILLDCAASNTGSREVGPHLHPARQRRVCGGGLTWHCGSAPAAPPRYSVGAARCPQCGSTEHVEEGQESMPKITVHGGPSLRARPWWAARGPTRATRRVARARAGGGR